MEKINWTSTTPINTTNLNQLQTNIENAINNVDNKFIYSTEEQRIGTWIDGKPLYRKVVYTTNVTNSYSDLNVSSIVNLRIMASVNDDIIFNTGRYNNSKDMFTWYVNTHQQIINIDIGSTWTFKNATIIIEYTKTTD